MVVHRGSDLRPASHSWPKNTPYKKVLAQVSDDDNSSTGPSTSGSNSDSKSTASQPTSPAKSSIERNPSIAPSDPASSHAVHSKVKKSIPEPETFSRRSTISGPSMAFLYGASEPIMQHSHPSTNHSSDRSASTGSSSSSINSAFKSIVQRSGTPGMDKGKGVERPKLSAPEKPQASCGTSNIARISNIEKYNIRLRSALSSAKADLDTFKELGGEEAFNKLRAENIQLRLQIDVGQAALEERMQEKTRELQRQIDGIQAKLTIPQTTIETMVAAMNSRLERRELDLQIDQAGLERQRTDLERQRIDLGRQKTATRDLVRKATENIKGELREIKMQLDNERASTEARVAWAIANFGTRLQQAEASLSRNRTQVASLYDQLQETQFQMAGDTAARLRTNTAIAGLERRLEEARAQVTQSQERAVNLQMSLWNVEARNTRDSRKRSWEDVNDEGVKRFRGESY